MRCRDTTSSIEERSDKKSYIFLAEYGAIQCPGKGLEKGVMRLLRLKYSSTNDGAIFVLHRHTVSDSTERDYIDIFLKNLLSPLWKEKIRESMNKFPHYPRPRQ